MGAKKAEKRAKEAGSRCPSCGQITALSLRRSPDWCVAHIADLMRRGAWVTGHSRRQLAAEWAVPVSTIANYAARATKEVAGETTDDMREEIRVATIERLQTVAAKAEMAGQFQAVVNSLRVLSEVAGVVSRAPMVNVEVGGLRERMESREAASFASRAASFIAEVHPELLGEFLRHVGRDKDEAITVEVER